MLGLHRWRSPLLCASLGACSSASAGGGGAVLAVDPVLDGGNRSIAITDELFKHCLVIRSQQFEVLDVLCP